MFDILLVFIALKWAGAVTWSWGIVFMPLWVQLAKIVTGVLLALWGIDLD